MSCHISQGFLVSKSSQGGRSIQQGPLHMKRNSNHSILYLRFFVRSCDIRKFPTPAVKTQTRLIQPFISSHLLFFNYRLNCNYNYKDYIFGEGSQISTNQKRKNTVFSILMGSNLRHFPENTVLYNSSIFNQI